jgi:hypothetical protein
MLSRSMAVLAVLVLGLANIAQASLGPFPVTDGSHTINISDPDNNMFGAVPSNLNLGTDVQWGPFRTHLLPTGFPNLDIDIIDGANSYSMQKATVTYNPGQNRMRIQDYTFSNGLRLEIVINNLAAPVIDASTQLGQIMSTAATTYTFNLRSATNLANVLSTFTVAAVPEPSAFALGGLVLGLVGGARVIRKRFWKK